MCSRTESEYFIKKKSMLHKWVSFACSPHFFSWKVIQKLPEMNWLKCASKQSAFLTLSKWMVLLKSMDVKDMLDSKCIFKGLWPQFCKLLRGGFESGEYYSMCLTSSTLVASSQWDYLQVEVLCLVRFFDPSVKEENSETNILKFIESIYSAI